MPYIREFNVEQPHEALKMKWPTELNLASPRYYGPFGEPQNHRLKTVFSSAFSRRSLSLRS